MKLQISENIPDNWDNTIASLGGTISHTGVHARYVTAGQANVTPRYITLMSDEDELVGAALGFQSRSPHGLLAPFTGRFWLVSMPAVRSDVDNALGEFLRQLEEYARRSRNVELEIGSFACDTGCRELENLGYRLIKRFEFELDLTPAEEELFAAMEYKRRKNINKAKRNGVIIQDITGEEGIAHLRRLQGHSSERIVARGGRDITHQYQPADDPVMILLESGLTRIIGAQVNNEIVSAGLFTCFNHLVYHTLSGHSAEAFNTQAPTLLIWDTILRYKKQGAKKFNFGGCKISAVHEGDPEHGVYVYKKAFGTQCIDCTSGHKVLRKKTYTAVCLLKGLLRR